MLLSKSSVCVRFFPVSLFFFFFQAEDGIRDKLVTGVQTCALPICSGHGGRGGRRTARHGRSVVVAPEIGRASCRERGEISGGAGLLKKKKKTETPHPTPQTKRRNAHSSKNTDIHS